MPTLRELLDQLNLDPQQRAAAERTIRTTWPGERVYISPANSRKDPGRRQAIAEAASRLPVSAVALRFGVSRQYVYAVVKMKR